MLNPHSLATGDQVAVRHPRFTGAAARASARRPPATPSGPRHVHSHQPDTPPSREFTEWRVSLDRLRLDNRP
ncbi:hypothetical protein IFM12275_65460 [Nocardia sputorum]|nr:hypothetical protein IFM12275_65460 [Nocardia sputorum]